MYKEVLRSIDNIEIYPVFSFVLFGIFFIGMLIQVFRLDKKYIDNMSGLPMEEKHSTTPINAQDHE